MAQSVLKYDVACRALAEARSVDEVKDIRDKAEAMRVYARQAQNRTLEVDAAEIRIRSERRLGEMLIESRFAGSLARRGRQPRGPRVAILRDIGINKKLSMRTQRLASLPVDKFESQIARWRDDATNAKGRSTPGLPTELNISRESRSAPMFAIAAGDIRLWSVAKLRRIHAALGRVAVHCGTSDRSVGDCVTDKKLSALLMGAE
jgi:hypothetical protein